LERGDLQEGFKLIRQRRLEEAREFFQELLKLNPGDVGALFALGCVHAALGERDKAIEEWRRCLEINPHMGKAHYALAWAYYRMGDYERGFRHVQMAYESGASPSLAQELRSLLETEAVAAEAEKPGEVAVEAEEAVEEVEAVEEGKLSRWITLSTYLIPPSISLIVLWFIGATSGFPKGFDAHVHIFKAVYILKFFPNFFWNYLWDSGVPHFAGSYPPMAYYIIAAFSRLTGLSVEAVINGWLSLSVIINLLGLQAFLYNVTHRRIPSILAPLLLLFTPAYWDYWLDVGAHARVFSLGLLGPFLYLASKAYMERRRSLILLLYILSALIITIHPIGGALALAYLILHHLISGDGILHKLRLTLETPLIALSLSSFYIAQYLFSNPEVRRRSIFSISYLPTKFEYLILPRGIHSLNILIIPLTAALTILYLYLRRRAGGVEDDEAKSWLLVFSILTSLSLLYGYVGYLSFYPSNLYISAIPPDYISTITSLNICPLIGILLALVEEKAKFRGVKYLGGILTALTIILGFLIEVPILRHSICDHRHFAPMDVIEVEEGDWQHRLAADAFEVTMWFATYHRVPLMKGYYLYLTPYLTWCDWSSHAIYKLRGNIDETCFLLDWHAVRWIVVNYNQDKFLNHTDRFRLIAERYGWYEFEYLNASNILSATDTPTILFIGSDEKYDLALRALSLTGLNSESCIIVKGWSRYIDDYTPGELGKFSALLLYGYRYRDIDAAMRVLSDYLQGGGGVFLEANDSPDYQSKSLPEPFPIAETHTSSVIDEWLFKASHHPITDGINFTAFSPPLFGGNPWGVSTSGMVRKWAGVILSSGGVPLIVAGEYGSGRVVWSGMNLLYHELNYRNREEGRFIASILRWLGGAGEVSTPRYRADFINPHKRIVELEEPCRGILFKEHYFRQWHATLEGDGVREKLKIYLAGPGMMYIPLPRGVEAESRITIQYDLSLPEKAGYMVSVISLIALLIITWRRPEWLI